MDDEKMETRNNTARWYGGQMFSGIASSYSYACRWYVFETDASTIDTVTLQCNSTDIKDA
jgi:hypothetical protein